MNMTQLECFTTLASTLNYVRTAEELNMTQPGVSRQIQSLEQELGARLFHRTTRSVSLTQVGAEFLPEAQQMLGIYYRSREWIAAFHQNAPQTLKIGYNDPHALVFLRKVLALILPDAQNLYPAFTLDQTDANLQRLVSGELDLVFGIRDAKFKNEKIVFTPLRREQFVCVLRKDHPLAEACSRKRRKTVSSEELLPYRQIINIPPYLLKNAFSRGHKLIPVNDTLQNILVTNSSEAYALVLAGLGYCLLPEYMLIPDKKLKFLTWQESPSAALGIYADAQTYQDKTSSLRKFVNCAAGLFS
ncbi:LysR family transcriptional regulator [Mitsuokella sp.]|uniref:LysR family transcriptional regulator n=1 Tax=unclassified Mitsuokella TaxID=2637239 RepID=UPI003D7CF853